MVLECYFLQHFLELIVEVIVFDLEVFILGDELFELYL